MSTFTNYPLFTVPVGEARMTLAELEAELRAVRARYSAPDDAKVIQAARGVCMFEVTWKGDPEERQSL